jgi:hypothetical protein
MEPDHCSQVPHNRPRNRGAERRQALGAEIGRTVACLEGTLDTG